MLTRDRPRTSVRVLMPAPAPLPSLSNALARQAAIFGPVDLDESPAASHEPWPALALQAAGYVPDTCVDRLGGGRSSIYGQDRDGPRHHGGVLRQDYLRSALSRLPTVAALVAALACHFRLP
jgi:hypothetical protein